MDRGVLSQISAGNCGSFEDAVCATADGEDEDGYNEKGNSLKNISCEENKSRQLHNNINCQPMWDR